MVFTSLNFVIFFLCIYSLYLCIGKNWQNRLLLLGSSIFYASWNWRFLALIAVTIITDYSCGLLIHGSKDNKRRKTFLLVSIFVNLAILGFFKYFNFFVGSLQELMAGIGLPFSPIFLHIALPIGISFYTFQSMSYTIDIYRRQMEPTRSFPAYALFVIFFTNILSGPIMRARTFLPQILSPRKLRLDNFYEGCYLIFWGVFQKVFIADNLLKTVNSIFNASAPYNGISVLIGAYACTFQIYCDFAGYSNMARGLGMLMGFDIMVNFNLPFFSTNVQEYWHRWHISLSTWIRDYVYVPVFQALSWIKGNHRIYLTLIATMVIMGLWHGAALTFVVWGIYYGCLLSLYSVIRARLHDFIKPKNPFLARAWFLVRLGFMFHITVMGALIFRAGSIKQLLEMTYGLAFNLHFVRGTGAIFSHLVFYLWLLVIIEIIQYVKKDLTAILKLNTLTRAVVYVILFCFLIIFGRGGEHAFIYAKF